MIFTFLLKPVKAYPAFKLYYFCKLMVTHKDNHIVYYKVSFNENEMILSYLFHTHVIVEIYIH